MFKSYCRHCIVFLFLFLYISATPHAKFCHYTVQRTISLMTTISISTVPITAGLSACQAFSVKQDPAVQNKISKEIPEIAGNYFGHLEIPDFDSASLSTSKKKWLGGTGIFEVPLFRLNKPRSPELLQKLWFT